MGFTTARPAAVVGALCVRGSRVQIPPSRLIEDCAPRCESRCDSNTSITCCLIARSPFQFPYKRAHDVILSDAHACAHGAAPSYAIRASRRTCFLHTFAAVHYTLELTLDKKKFLFVSLDGLIADIAWQVVKEGHEVKLFCEAQSEREIADGFVPKTDDWVADVPWADVIVFDDVLGQGAKAHQLRQTGKLVVGGTPYTDQLEDDRAFGQQELKKAGVPIIPQENFHSFDEAIAFVRANPNRYVIKPSGEAQNLKQLLFVGEDEDGKDVIQVLEDYQRAWADRVKAFQLQRRIVGVEVAAGAFFNGKEFVLPVNMSFLCSKLMLTCSTNSLRSSTARNSCCRSTSTSSTRSCFPATSARPPVRWGRRCSGASRRGSSMPPSKRWSRGCATSAMSATST